MTSHALQPQSARSQVRAPVLVLDEFLVASEWQSLLEFTLEHEIRFAGSEVLSATGLSNTDHGYRRSRVMFDLGRFESLFSRRLVQFLPHVLWRLGEKPLHLSKLEIQLTATNHAEFFRAHTDNNAVEVNGRKLTFVYFFHREPRRFGGGELCIYNTTQDSREANKSDFQVVYPMQNQIVFFPSHHLHEIRTVTCPSMEFADSRFTVNGWYHQ